MCLSAKDILHIAYCGVLCRNSIAYCITPITYYEYLRRTETHLVSCSVALTALWALLRMTVRRKTISRSQGLLTHIEHASSVVFCVLSMLLFAVPHDATSMVKPCPGDASAWS